MMCQVLTLYPTRRTGDSPCMPVDRLEISHEVNIITAGVVGWQNKALLKVMRNRYFCVNPRCYDIRYSFAITYCTDIIDIGKPDDKTNCSAVF